MYYTVYVAPFFVSHNKQSFVFNPCPFQDLEAFEIQNSTNTTNSTNSTNITSIPGTALMGGGIHCGCGIWLGSPPPASKEQLFFVRHVTFSLFHLLRSAEELRKEMAGWLLKFPESFGRIPVWSPPYWSFYPVVSLNCNKTGSRRLEESGHLRCMLGEYCVSGVCLCRALMISLSHMSCGSQESQSQWNILKLFFWRYAIDTVHCTIIIYIPQIIS